jgi:hypothetical protein
MNAIINEKNSRSSWQNIQLWMSLQKCYMFIHVHKCLTSRHDYSLVPNKVTGEAHRRKLTRRYVLPAERPSPRVSFQPNSSPL